MPADYDIEVDEIFIEKLKKQGYKPW